MNGIIKALNVNKFYKLISLAGVLFTIVGGAVSNNKLTTIGLLTFIYGILTWMLGSGFHIETSIKLNPKYKIKPLHIALGFMILSIILFLIYIFLVYYIQNS